MGGVAGAPFRGAVPSQGGSEVPVVRGAVLVEAPVDVLDFPAEISQARLAGRPVERGDRIVLPFRERFPEAAGYYQAALHELGHWTGHASRLNRATL